MSNETYTFVQDQAMLDVLCDVLRAAPLIAFDFETTGLNFVRDKVVGWALSVREGEAFYIPVRHHMGQQLAPAVVAAAMKPIFEDPTKIICIHNAKFDTRFLAREEVPIIVHDENVYDTLLETYVAAPYKMAKPPERFGLKDLVELIWKKRPQSFDDLFSKKDKNKNIASVPIEEAGYYACADADNCLKLHNLFYPVIQTPKIRAGFIYAIEHRLWPIIREIEETGIPLDVEFLQREAALIQQAAAMVEQIVMDQASAAVGHPVSFSISSPKQLGEVLFDMMKLPIQGRSKTGAPSTDELSLTALIEDYPICKNILTYRSMLSAIQTMGTKLPDSMWPEDGRIHTEYNQAGATSGRFASSNPNLQNIAKVKEWTVVRSDGSQFKVTVKPRDAFVATGLLEDTDVLAA